MSGYHIPCEIPDDGPTCARVLPDFTAGPRGGLSVQQRNPIARERHPERRRGGRQRDQYGWLGGYEGFLAVRRAPGTSRERAA